MIRAHNDRNKVIVIQRHKHTYLKAVGRAFSCNTNFAYLAIYCLPAFMNDLAK